jgi:hypothetical protein
MGVLRVREKRDTAEIAKGGRVLARPPAASRCGFPLNISCCLLSVESSAANSPIRLGSQIMTPMGGSGTTTSLRYRGSGVAR